MVDGLGQAKRLPVHRDAHHDLLGVGALLDVVVDREVLCQKAGVSEKVAEILSWANVG